MPPRRSTYTTRRRYVRRRPTRAFGRARRGRAIGYAPSNMSPRFKAAPSDNDWMNSIIDPCNSKGVKIPDNHIFPTATEQIKLNFTVAQTTLTNGFSITPSDIRRGLAVGGSSLLKMYCDDDGFGNIGATYPYLQADYAGEHDLVALHAKMGEARVSSACVKMFYTGNDLNNEGTIVAAILPGHNLLRAAAGAGEGAVTSFAQLQGSQHAVTLVARHGAEVRWVPTTKYDMDFRDYETQAVYGTDGDDTTQIAVMWTGVNAASQFQVEVYINVEYIPKWGTSGDTAPVAASQHAINMVKAISANPKNLISPTTGEGSSFVDVATKVVQGAVGVGEFIGGVVAKNPALALKGAGDLLSPALKRLASSRPSSGRPYKRIAY